MSIELVLVPVGIAVAQSISSAMDKRSGLSNAYTLPTVMTDASLLKQALSSYGCEADFLESNDVSTEIGDLKILFEQSDRGVFTCLFDEEVAHQDAEEFIENIQQEYKYLVQQETYQRLIERAAEKGLVLETEEVDEEQTIKLTYNVHSRVGD